MVFKIFKIGKDVSQSIKSEDSGIFDVILCGKGNFQMKIKKVIST